MLKVLMPVMLAAAVVAPRAEAQSCSVVGETVETQCRSAVKAEKVTNKRFFSEAFCVETGEGARDGCEQMGRDALNEKYPGCLGPYIFARNAIVFSCGLKLRREQQRSEKSVDLIAKECTKVAFHWCRCPRR